MGDEARKVDAMGDEVERLKWRISTLEAVELECARALTALEASEARYRHLLDKAGFPITISSAGDSTLLFANPLACQWFGLEPSSPAGRRMLAFYLDPAVREGIVARLRAHGIVRDEEVLMLDGRGRSRTVLLTASLVTYEGQEAVLATSNDITDRRHAEALFRSLVETSPDGIGISDLMGTLTYASPRLLAIFGYQRPEDMLGRNIREFVPGEEHTRVEERLKAMLKGEFVGPMEWTGLHRNGHGFPQETAGEVLRNPDGSPSSYFFIVRDLSNRKRMERAIRWGEKLQSLGLMAAGIAHELNNAFQVTHGHLELAQDQCGDAHMTGLLAGVGEGVDRATRLAREMLAYSGQTLRVEAPLHLGRVVEEVLALRRVGLAPDIRLAFEPVGELPPVHGDEDQVMKVLSALVLNAMEALAGRGGSVLVGVEAQELGGADLGLGFWPVPGREGRFLRLQVRDSGEGVTGAQLERICDPFFTTKGPGRGLGLSAALGILRAHTACLQILSQPGEGTTVRVYFPISTYTPSELPPQEVSHPVSLGILVAEDDAAIRDLVVRMLPKWGYGPVFAARNGAEALELFRAHHEAIGLFLTDATMPQMSGPEAFEAMRKLRPTLRAVLMSGYSEAFGQGTAATFGFKGFLPKPFSYAQLKTRLEEARAEQPSMGR